MNSEPFLKPRLTGDRFAGGAIPLEVLADFAVLSEMIVEVAKWRYREDNPKRKRVPRGFADGVTLKLTGIESGSAIPVIGLVLPALSLFPSPVQTYVEEARRAIVRAVWAAEQNQAITGVLPSKFLTYFARFGRNLLEGEAIEFTDATLDTPAHLTRETRRKLILASSASEFTEAITVRGSVHEIDQRANTFQMTRPDGAIFRDIPIEAQHYDTVLEACNGFRDKIHVRVDGIGSFARDNRLRKIEHVERVVILDPLDIWLRIDELRQLGSGWLDGKGVPPPSDGLDWLAHAWDTQLPHDLPFPCLFPTPEGGVLAEWQLEPWLPSLEIDLSTRQADWHEMNVKTNDEETQSLNLRQQDDWVWLAKRVRDLQGQGEVE